MTRIIISIVLVLALCVLVMLNLDHTTTVNFFWNTFEKVPVVAVGLIGFVAGVLYSFSLYASRFFAGVRRDALASRRQEIERREKEAAAGTQTGDAEAPEAPEGKGRRPRR